MGMWDEKQEDKKTEGLWAKKSDSDKGGGLWGKEPERDRNPGTGIWDKRIHLPETFAGEFSSLMYGNYHAGSMYDSQLPGEFNGPPTEQQLKQQANQQQATTNTKEKPKKEDKSGLVSALFEEEAQAPLLELTGKSEQSYSYGSPFLAGGVKKVQTLDEMDEKIEVDATTGEIITKNRWGNLPITQADVERILKMLKEFSLEKKQDGHEQAIDAVSLSKKEKVLWLSGLLLVLIATVWAIFNTDFFR